MIKRVTQAVLIAAVMMTSTACNTVQGLGQDIESVGEAGEEAIN